MSEADLSWTREVALDAYVYLYQLVTMDVTRRQLTTTVDGVRYREDVLRWISDGVEPAGASRRRRRHGDGTRDPAGALPAVPRLHPGT